SAMEFLVTLRAHAARAGDSRRHEVYVKEYLQCQKILAAEQLAEMTYEKIQLLFATSEGEKPEHAVAVESAAKEARDLAADYPYFKLQFLALRLSATTAELQMNYQAVFQVCVDAFELLDKYPQFSNKARKAEYAIRM